MGVPPGEHGVVGYRIATHSSVLNVLRWATADGDARRLVEPKDFQPVTPFLGHRPPIVTRAEFEGGGFTSAHLRDGRWHPWRVPSTLIAEAVMLARAEEPFVYAYYDGLDKVAHERGLRIHYDAELSFVDRLAVNIFERLPSGAALVVTADHGLVHTGDQLLEFAPAVLDLTESLSGEARFRWLHAEPGRADELLAVTLDAHGDDAWVFGVETIIGDGWLGPIVTSDARERLGDVAVLPRGVAAFLDPMDTGPIELIGRHGGISEDELLVPLLAAVR